MSITTTIKHESGYLHVATTGEDESLEAVIAYGEEIYQEAMRVGTTKVLANEQKLVYKLGTFNTYELAAYWSHKIRGSAKIAIVANPDNMQDLQFFEDVAVNRGVRVRAFRSEEEAKAWLLD